MEQVGGVFEVTGNIVEQNGIQTVHVDAYEVLTQDKVTGQVNGLFQLVTSEGEIYEISDTVLGAKVMDHMGRFVEVTGSIVEDEG